MHKRSVGRLSCELFIPHLLQPNPIAFALESEVDNSEIRTMRHRSHLFFFFVSNRDGLQPNVHRFASSLHMLSPQHCEVRSRLRGPSPPRPSNAEARAANWKVTEMKRMGSCSEYGEHHFLKQTVLFTNRSLSIASHKLVGKRCQCWPRRRH